GVDVADHQHHVRLLGGDQWLEPPHDLGCLLRVAARANLESDVWPRDTEIPKEHVGQLFVVVLPGVDQQGREEAAPGQRPHDWRNLHEVRPGADDTENPVRHSRVPEVAAPGYHPVYRLSRRGTADSSVEESQEPLA